MWLMVRYCFKKHLLYMSLHFVVYTMKNKDGMVDCWFLVSAMGWCRPWIRNCIVAICVHMYFANKCMNMNEYERICTNMHVARICTSKYEYA